MKRSIPLFFALLLSLAVPAAASSADWPQFHFGADRSGFNPGETTLSASNLAELGLSWRTTIRSAPLSAPVVGAGTVYVGSNDGSLYALNASTGGIVWRGATGSSDPAVAGC
jgi:eukaryotic-like serine/threonine-protein kinase